jgi:hypothetical protein
MKKARAQISDKLLFLVIVMVVLAVAAAVYGYFGYKKTAKTDGATYTTARMTQAEVDARKNRILRIYSDLQLGADYKLTNQDISGEKRVYSWDSGRTYSSVRSYVRELDVDKTVAELRPKIEQAGFSLIGEPYPNAVDVELHFKSAKGEYVRLRVSSKPRDDAIRQAAPNEPDYSKLAYRDAPSNVQIKVNLDDNNE